MDLILEIYRVEHEAKKLRIVRTPAHLELRRRRAQERSIRGQVLAA
jgi:hypothetical protein